MSLHDTVYEFQLALTEANKRHLNQELKQTLQCSFDVLEGNWKGCSFPFKGNMPTVAGRQSFSEVRFEWKGARLKLFVPKSLSRHDPRRRVSTVLSSIRALGGKELSVC